MSLRNTRRDGAHAHLGYQLDRNTRLWIYVLEVVNQLREILDGVDIVMRRRRDQADAGYRVTHSRDHFIHLVAGQLAAFTGLRPLRHLDLKIVGIDEVMRSHAETPRCNLLDGAAPQVSAGVPFETLFVFSALAGIGAASDAVHGDRQSLVRLFGYRAKRHSAGGESLDDFDGGLQ